MAALVNCWLAPWLVFHFCLGALALARHTAPHIPLTPPGMSYDEGRAALGGSVTLLLPGWMRFIVHGANYAAVQQVAASVPFHGAARAHEALRQRLGPYLTEAAPSLQLLLNVVYKWQVYDEQRGTYVTIDEAAARRGGGEQAQRQQQQQEGGTASVAMQ
jgi:fatty acid desaturase